MLQTMKNHWWRMPKGKDDVSQAQSVAKIFGIPVTLSSSKKPCKKLRSHFLAHTAAAMRTLPTLTIFHRQPEYRQDQFAAKITMANHKYTPLQNTTASTTTTKAANTNNINNNDNSNMPIIFDSRGELVSELPASIDFSPSTFSFPTFISTRNDHFDFSFVQPQLA
uniref:Uncharacterized protein n=1 Tax=Populus alba TaxID=43335 RepID=A0A4U5QTC7_POPAL|nr:hypothetical protein D5086_0000059840 [Populus alba]